MSDRANILMEPVKLMSYPDKVTNFKEDLRGPTMYKSKDTDNIALCRSYCVSLSLVQCMRCILSLRVCVMQYYWESLFTIQGDQQN